MLTGANAKSTTNIVHQITTKTLFIAMQQGTLVAAIK